MKLQGLSARWPFRPPILTVLLFALLVVGCDTFNSDVTDPEVKVSRDELFVLADGETVIDITALVSSNFPGRLSVTTLPQHGTLRPIAEGLLRYAPHKGLKRSRDSFEFSVFNNDNIVSKDTIYINVETDSTNLPCNIYPIADYVNRFDGDRVSVSVLNNDILCGKSVNLSLYQPVAGFLPHHGTAEAIGATVVYTPGSSFTGKDTVIYKLTNAQNSASVAYGFVYINRDSVCAFALSDDIYRIDTLRRPATYFLDVFANDILCDSLKDYNISVITAPWNGTVLQEGRGFTYRLNAQRSTVTDEFTYSVSKGGIQKTARAMIRLEGGAGPCLFRAVSDSLDITALSTSIVYIDVLKNDQVCDSLKTFRITREPKNGNASIDNNLKRIRYERVVMKSDSVQYEICNGKVCSRATAYIKQGE